MKLEEAKQLKFGPNIANFGVGASKITAQLSKNVSLTPNSKDESLEVRNHFSGKLFWDFTMLVWCIRGGKKLGMLKIKNEKSFYSYLGI